MLKFTMNRRDSEIIDRIVRRAMSLNHRFDKISLLMDISATHANGCTLRLEELLAAKDSDFAYDVFGIVMHIDRDTGQLDGFLPRFAA